MLPMKYKLVVWLSKGRRVLASIPIADLLAFAVSVAAILTIGASIVGGNVKPETLPFWTASKSVAKWFAIILIPILISKTWLECNRRRYDPALIFTLQKDFESLETKRAEAATVCIAFLRKTDEPDETKRWTLVDSREREKVEPVLDFFEDVGFYLHGDQFSDDVVHHNCHHWVRGWYSVLKPYIDYVHNVQKEKAAYVWIEALFGRLTEIEKHYPDPQTLLTDTKDKIEFLLSEGGEDSGAPIWLTDTDAEKRRLMKLEQHLAD